MPTHFKYSQDFLQRIDDKFRVDLLQDEILDHIAEEIRDRVLHRTDSGKDFLNREFEDYTPSYKARKEKEKGATMANKPNLRLSGDMLDSFFVECRRNADYSDNAIFFLELKHFYIFYGFRNKDMEYRYMWNADNYWGYSRDFLGVPYGEPLLSDSELFNVISYVVSNWRGNKQQEQSQFQKALAKPLSQKELLFQQRLSDNQKQIAKWKVELKTANTRDREDIIHKFYQKIRNGEEVSVLNYALGEEVFVNAKSASETNYHASKYPIPTEAVLELYDVLKHATIDGYYKPKNKGYQKKFKQIIEMSVNLDGVGMVKLTVGVLESDKHIQYCITDVYM